MLYEDLFGLLEKEHVRYVVAGGVAMVLHGVIRFTADLDLILDLSEENLAKFLGCMDALGFRPRLPVKAQAILDPEVRKQWRYEKNMQVFTFIHPTRPLSEVDVLLEELIPFSDLEAQAVTKRASGITIRVASKEHIKALKRMSGRAQDLADIQALEYLERLDSGDERES